MSMEHRPKVSVLIPTYNYAYCLDEAMQSVLDQTLPDLELIVIDDCSKDNTDDVMQKYLADPRIIYMRNEKNLGLVESLNRGLKYAKGEFIARMDADDICLHERLVKQKTFLDQNKDITVVASTI